MPKRLSASDGSFLRPEQGVTATYVAAVASFPGARSGFDHAVPPSRGEPATDRGATRVNVVVSKDRRPQVRADTTDVPDWRCSVVSLSAGWVSKGQALATGFSSYHGCTYYGFNPDRDAMGDGDVLTGMISESPDELAGSVG
jgi:hypothetical protein